MPFYLWSLTSGSNANADPSINWAEGQAPSSVNDSARAMMARLTELVRDISGRIVTTGTSTAYVVASNQVFDTLAHMDGAMIAFVPHATSGATVTLNVDGLGAKPLRSAPGVELTSGVMPQGTPFVCTFNNADAAWYLQGFAINNTTIPIGGLMPFLSATPPNSSFILPVGQAISRTTYATLFALTGTTFGIGDGTTTFNVPDLRNRTIFGLDDGTGAGSRITVAGGNIDGRVLGNAGGGQNQTLTTAQLPAISVTPAFTGNAVTPTFTGNAVTPTLSGNGSFTGTASGTFFPSSVANDWVVDRITTGGGNFVPANTSNTCGFAQITPAGTVGVGTFAISGILPSGSISAVTPTGSVSAVAFGSGNSHTILPPAMVLPYILRII